MLPPALGVGEQVQHPRAQPLAAVGGRAERMGDAIGQREPDAEDARQLVRSLAHDAMARAAVLCLDAWRQVGEAVGREQQVQLARAAQPVPGGSRLAGPSAAQPGGRKRRARIAVDRLEHALLPKQSISRAARVRRHV